MKSKGSIKRYLLMFLVGFLLLSSAVNTICTAIVINTKIKNVLITKAKEQVYEIGKQAEQILANEEDPIPILQKFVEEKEKQENVTYAIVINTNVKAIAHSDPQKIGKTYKDTYTIEGATEGKSQFTRWYAEVQKIWTYDIMQPIYKDGQLYGVMDIGVPESGIKDIVKSVIMYQVFISLISFVVIGILMWMIIRKITNAIQSLSKIVSKTADLDFTHEEGRKLDKRNDEIGSMALAIMDMRIKLKSVIEGIINTSHSLSDASTTLSQISEDSVRSTDEITTAIEEMAKATEEQALDTEKGAEQINQLAKNMDQVLESTRQIVEKTSSMDTLSSTGVQTVLRLEEWSIKNKKSSENVSVIVQEVEKTSSDISSIVNTITEIASQTNLLSLNASIESARAGEAGKGFAVVADEIRKLSEQTSRATEDIKEKIQGIQEISHNAVTEIMDGLEIVVKNSEVTQETKTIFENIKSELDQTILVAKEVTQLYDQMNEKKEEIVGVIENISASSEETSASTEEISASAQEQLLGIETVAQNAIALKEISEELRKEMDNFKL
ncbi:methyl-accepting chemotaxis protein [Inediibacterium massiliense]|uniref:methyl-accepting chemotaxis protein n=1 Tax=Inediibacterium massiliense TaxID=1658111 RepID=UPI0006B40B9F|nr:methyl-accepting chemotaxis protein [Inediibacterium massiliense]